MAIADRDFVINKLNELTTYAKKKFGQNFLIDQTSALKITDAVKVNDKTTIVEIGPGLGALTYNLVNKGNNVIAYDIDEVMVTHLQKYFSYASNLEVLQEDFLKVDLNIYKEKEVAFIGNLPYYITTPIIEKILVSNLNVTNLVFMVQKEVYPRLIAKVGSEEYGPLSILIEYIGTINKVCDVNHNSFYPAPHVDSLVFKIDYNKELDNDIDIKKFYSFVKQMFNMRRKTILNNLNSYTNNKEKSEALLTKASIDYTRRPETLTLLEYLRLYKCANY